MAGLFLCDRHVHGRYSSNFVTVTVFSCDVPHWTSDKNGIGIGYLQKGNMVVTFHMSC